MTTINYLLILMSVIFLLNTSKYGFKVNQYLLYFYLIIYSVIAGFRDAGIDTQTYINIYNSVNVFSYEMLPFININYIEVGYNNLIYMFKLFGLPFEVFNSVTTFIFLIVYFSFAKNFFSKKIATYGIILLLFTFSAYQLSFNQVRQGVAITFVLFSIKYLYHEKYLKFVFILLVGSVFHSSSLMYIILLPFRKVQLNINWRYFSLILMPILYVSFIGKNSILFVFDIISKIFSLGNIGQRFIAYSNSDVFGASSQIGMITIISYFALWVINYLSSVKSFYENENEKDKFEFIISLLFFGYLIFFFLFDFIILSQRLLYFFDLLYPLVISFFIMKNNNKYTYIIAALTFFIMSFKVIITRV